MPADLSFPAGTPQPNTAAPLIQVTGVHHTYPHADSPALFDVNLSIRQGSCFGLLGPNGAGKTTLISLLTGLLLPQQGEISVGGRSFARDALAIKQMSALVPQEYAFYPTLTGRENLEFFAGLYEIPAAAQTARLAYCVEVCSLEKVLHKRADSYSGGIKRRLNLALGLLRDPDILYLDEPTVGIDAQSRHFILEAIANLSAAGMTIVYTSHYMEEVEQLCDEAAIIDDGRVVLQESMSSLLSGSQQLCVTPIDPLPPEFRSELLDLALPEWDGSRLTLTPSAQCSVPRLLAELEQHGVQIAQLQMGGTRLEQVYLQATRRELRQ